MKEFFLVCLLVFSFTYAYSDSNDSLKQQAKQLFFSNNLNEKTVTEIISNMANQKIPSSGNTDFIKISGRINDFGKTANVNLKITGPDNFSENITSPLLETGRYYTLYPINSQSQLGTYKIETKFAGETKTISYFHLTKTPIPKSNFPSWLLRTFEWWAQDQISDIELINSVQHLANLGLVVTSDKSSSSLQVVITGDKMVRRGTTHTINVLVTDGYLPIEGSKVTLTIEDYGEDIIREFDGFTNKSGYFVFSWEIPKSFDDYETLLAYISVSGNGSSQTHLWKFQVYCLPGTANCKIDGN